jgi:hypothetical protein
VTPTSWTPIAEHLLTDLGGGPWPWAVLKNHEHLPVVLGDMDLCVAARHHDAFTRAIASSLRPMGTLRMIHCDHFLGVRLIFVVPAVGAAPGNRALELDLADGVWWKGTPLCSAERIISDFVVRSGDDPAPHTRVGFQAALSLTVSGIRRDGSLDTRLVQRRGLRPRAENESEVFVAAMELLHGEAGVSGARAFLSGEWTAAAGLRIIARRTKRSAIPPYPRLTHFVSRKIHRHWRGLPRVVSGSTDDWISRISRGHEGYRLG